MSQRPAAEAVSEWLAGIGIRGPHPLTPAQTLVESLYAQDPAKDRNPVYQTARRAAQVLDGVLTAVNVPVTGLGDLGALVFSPLTMTMRAAGASEQDIEGFIGSARVIPELAALATPGPTVVGQVARIGSGLGETLSEAGLLARRVLNRAVAQGRALRPETTRPSVTIEPLTDAERTSVLEGAGHSLRAGESLVQINWATIRDPESVDALIDAVVQARPLQPRTISVEESRQMARELGVTVEQFLRSTQGQITPRLEAAERERDEAVERVHEYLDGRNRAVPALLAAKERAATLAALLREARDALLKEPVTTADLWRLLRRIDAALPPGGAQEPPTPPGAPSSLEAGLGGRAASPAAPGGLLGPLGGLFGPGPSRLDVLPRRRRLGL